MKELDTKSQVKPKDGRYLYCVADSEKTVSLGKIGIEGNEVYTIPHQDLCAVVHRCPPEPYTSKDEEVVKEWLMTHEKVVDLAWEKFSTVLPLGFDTIVKGNENISAEKNVKKWLREDYENLVKKIEKVMGRAEYGVQISWDPERIAERIVETTPEIKKLKEEMNSKPRGAAYLDKQKLEKLIKKEMEKEADLYFKDFYGKIKKHLDDVRIEKTKKIKDKQMLMNLSCLVYKDKIKELGKELGKINKMPNFFVRFTGPWPPYSFVTPG